MKRVFLSVVTLLLGSAQAAPDWTFAAPQLHAELGCAVDSVGDLNADGYDDVIIGARHYTNPHNNEGRAYIFAGGPDGLVTTEAWVTESGNTNAQLGYAVAGAGDVNGDGFDDVIVGARWMTLTEPSQGSAFVYFGAAEIPEWGIPMWSAAGTGAHVWFGHSVTGAGDVNGDGYDDVLVSAPSQGGAFGASAGHVYAYYGGPDGLSPQAKWSAQGTDYYAMFGFDVAGAGDVNGDGYDDVIIGEHWWGADEEGRAHVYLGSETGLQIAPVWSAEHTEYRANFGRAVDGAGDVNGDGYDDIIVGADLASNESGEAYVYLGGPEGVSVEPAWTFVGTPTSRFGFSVAGVGDIDRDGFDDILVGAAFDDDPVTDEGRAFLFRGTPDGLTPSPFWAATSGEDFGRMGYSVAGADINGDGFSDVLVGAPRMDEHNTVGGVVFAYADPGPTRPWVEAGDVLTGRPNQTFVETITADFADPDEGAGHLCVWDWGDGESDEIAPCNPGDVAQAKHVYSKDGLYTVTLTVTDETSHSGTDTTIAEIGNVEPPDPSYTPGCSCRVRPAGPARSVWGSLLALALGVLVVVRRRPR